MSVEEHKIGYFWLQITIEKKIAANEKERA